MPSHYGWKFGKYGHVKSFKRGYYQAKRNAKMGAGGVWSPAGKRELQRKYNYSKVSVPFMAKYYRRRARGAPRGMVTSGSLRKGYRSKTLLTDDIPKQNGLPLKQITYDFDDGIKDLSYDNSPLPPLLHSIISGDGAGIISGNTYQTRIGSFILSRS